VNTTLKRWGNSVGVRIPKEALENSNLLLDDSLEIVAFEGGFTLQKKPNKSFADISKPLINTKDWKFDREEANERR
jgi:antitoxin component of MazEF toxin-antitoxin module